MTHQASNKVLPRVIIVSIMILFTMAACSSNGNEGELTPSVTPTLTESPVPTNPAGTVVVTIGNLTDMTGPGAHAMEYSDMALEDMVRYYNSENLIPGVELKVIEYDTQFDPSKDIPGYEWLKRRGAHVIFSPIPSVAVVLKPFLKEDGIAMFSLSPTEQALSPPGYVFSPSNVLCRFQSYSLLKWVAENANDFPEGRPAKIGGAFWAESYGASLLSGAKQYVEANPEQYEWSGGYLTDIPHFNWTVEVEKLKDCDYVIPPVPMTQFVEQYRDAGCDARFIGFDAHLGFLGMIDDAGLWDEVDGMLFIKPGYWWNDEGEIMDLVNELLFRYHSGDVEEITRRGVGYQAVQGIYVMFEVIAGAADKVGTVPLNSEDIYETALGFSMDIDGCIHAFGENRRAAIDCLSVYELRAGEEDIFRLNSDWIPVVYQP